MEMLERKIDTYLAKWKNTLSRKPLIVKGARQIGKPVSGFRLLRLKHVQGALVEVVTLDLGAAFRTEINKDSNGPSGCT